MLILKTVLYVLVVIANSVVNSLLLPIQVLGSGAFYNLAAPMLNSLFINLAIITLVVSLVISALLYAVGRLIGHTIQLETRLARLEAKARTATYSATNSGLVQARSPCSSSISR